ncbi:MAG TPA: hypothetical protein VEX17_04700, partial [Bacillales bacterium]|nr:hypothetical protein [Bacillales bacterium]
PIPHPVSSTISLCVLFLLSGESIANDSWIFETLWYLSASQLLFSLFVAPRAVLFYGIMLYFRFALF